MKFFQAVLIFLFLALVALIIFDAKQNEDFRRQNPVSSHELKPVLYRLMLELSRKHQPAVAGIASDGLWHERTVTLKGRQGDLEYDLRIRRRQMSRILDVQVEDHDNHVLLYNFKVSLQD